MRTFLILLSLLLTPLAGAQSPQPGAPTATQTAAPSPYQGRVPVADQGNEARDKGFSEALGQVLERVSGQPAASPQLLPLLSRAPRLVQRYGYERDPATAQLMLVATFEQRGVDSAVRAQRLPVWGATLQAAEEIDLSITGLRGIRDYGRGIAAAEALPGVRKLSVIGADESRLLLRVRVEGGGAALAAAPAGVLLRTADANGALVYSLAP